ncbi:MAG: prepilin peptidase [Defluviicoccus sp.]|nr:MAG: prepilin peptidase [Defluviicoccus sp.]
MSGGWSCRTCSLCRCCSGTRSFCESPLCAATAACDRRRRGLWLFYAISRLYRWLRHRDGLGLGDAKLLAAGGAWVSWWGLPTVVLLAAVTALLVALVRRALGDRSVVGQRLAFGPELCLGIWLVWLYGPLTVG